MPAYLTVQQIADIADRKRAEANHSKVELAERIGRHRSQVARALTNPKDRDRQLLLDVLEHYGIDTDRRPRYMVHVEQG